jgi:hypothetical protein
VTGAVAVDGPSFLFDGEEVDPFVVHEAADLLMLGEDKADTFPGGF